jgi:hypothetical protein
MLVENLWNEEGGLCLSSCKCPGMRVVDCSNDQLAETADEHSVDKENSATAPFGDDAAVDDDNDDSHSSQDARVHEWRSNVGHLEEVCTVSCRFVSLQSDQCVKGILILLKLLK